MGRPTEEEGLLILLCTQSPQGGEKEEEATALQHLALGKAHEQELQLSGVIISRRVDQNVWRVRTSG